MKKKIIIERWDNRAILYSGIFNNTKECLESAVREGKDLQFADLELANLYSADLYSANLYSADLRSANLESANLRSANLESADLYSADLYSANLRSANLYSANLRSANLYSADLYSANLRSADLYSANLRSADLYSAEYGKKIIFNFCLCKWWIVYNDHNEKPLKIGCKQKTFKDWDFWFKSKEVYDTKRNTIDFKMIHESYNFAKKIYAMKKKALKAEVNE